MLITAAPILVVAGLLASIAAACDLRARRIPNWLTAGGLLVGVVSNLVLGFMSSGGPGMVAGGLSAVTGALLGFGLLLPLYALRVAGDGHAVGAGDVKLLAALGAVLGPQLLVSAAIYGAMIGGIQSMIILIGHGRLGLILHQTLVMHTPPTLSGAKAPYAVPIAAGVFLAMLLPPAFRF